MIKIFEDIFGGAPEEDRAKFIPNEWDTELQNDPTPDKKIWTTTPEPKDVWSTYDDCRDLTWK